MRRLVYFLSMIFFINGYSQLRDQQIQPPSVVNSIVNQSPGSIFNIFSPDKFKMNHSYSMSYSAFGGHGLAMGVYTNSMLFKLADNMSFQVDASLYHSPYNTFGKDAASQFSGFSISNARFDYRPAENFLITLQYQSLPMNYYSPFDGMTRRFNPFLSPSNDPFIK